MAQRSGLPSLEIVAREMCRLITKYSPVIRLLYPGNAALMAALAAAEAACTALEEEISGVLVPGD
jgi:hypothetical protein